MAREGQYVGVGARRVGQGTQARRHLARNCHERCTAACKLHMPAAGNTFGSIRRALREGRQAGGGGRQDFSASHYGIAFLSNL